MQNSGWVLELTDDWLSCPDRTLGSRKKAPKKKKHIKIFWQSAGRPGVPWGHAAAVPGKKCHCKNNKKSGGPLFCPCRVSRGHPGRCVPRLFFFRRRKTPIFHNVRAIRAKSPLKPAIRVLSQKKGFRFGHPENDSREIRRFARICKSIRAKSGHLFLSNLFASVVCRRRRVGRAGVRSSLLVPPPHLPERPRFSWLGLASFSVRMGHLADQL